MRRRLLIIAAALSTASCAAARAPRPMAVAGVAHAEAEKEEPAYERILGSFAIEPTLIVYLDPATCERHFDASGQDLDDLRAIARSLHGMGSMRGEGAALLDWAALQWFEGNGEAAYGAMMDAERIFAELGDAQGLAHAYEWLGYFFHKSDEVAKAGEHLSVAYHLYKLLGDSRAADRVLAYAR